MGSGIVRAKGLLPNPERLRDSADKLYFQGIATVIRPLYRERADLDTLPYGRKRILLLYFNQMP